MCLLLFSIEYKSFNWEKCPASPAAYIYGDFLHSWFSLNVLEVSNVHFNYENIITHLQETWQIQNKITYSSTTYYNCLF